MAVAAYQGIVTLETGVLSALRVGLSSAVAAIQAGVSAVTIPAPDPRAIHLAPGTWHLAPITVVRQFEVGTSCFTNVIFLSDTPAKRRNDNATLFSRVSRVAALDQFGHVAPDARTSPFFRAVAPSPSPSPCDHNHGRGRSHVDESN